MQKQTKSILDELSNISFTKDKENVVESRASHVIESAIRLLTYIRENFDPETAYKLEKKFHSAIKNMDANKFSKGRNIMIAGENNGIVYSSASKKSTEV